MLQKKHSRKKKKALQKEKKAFDDLITSQKQISVEKSKLVEKLQSIKGLLSKAQQDLETKNNALNAELEKVKVSEISTKTFSKIIEVSTQTVSEMDPVTNVKK